MDGRGARKRAPTALDSDRPPKRWVPAERYRERTEERTSDPGPTVPRFHSPRHAGISFRGSIRVRVPFTRKPASVTLVTFRSTPSGQRTFVPFSMRSRFAAARTVSVDFLDKTYSPWVDRTRCPTPKSSWQLKYPTASPYTPSRASFTSRSASLFCVRGT